MYYLYFLIDPNTNNVRYIGVTNNINRRYKEHLRDYKRMKSHKDKWINSLALWGQKPLMEIRISNESKENILNCEIQEIKNYTGLTNSTNGGEYFTFDEKVLVKLRKNNKGKNNPCFGKVWTKEERQKLSDIRQGRKLTETWKENLRKSASNRKEIEINGVKYDSINQAAKKLGLNWETVKKRYS